MTYLFSQYWMFIALAFTLGLFVGWATCGEEDDKGSGWLAWAIVGFLAALFLALFKVVPGFAGHLLEVALLLSGAYAIGCTVGCGGHWASGGARWIAQAKRLAGAGGAAAAAANAGAKSGVASSASGATSATTDAQSPPTATGALASAGADATADAAGASAPRMTTDSARSLLAQQNKKASRAASGGSPVASAPVAAEPASGEEIAPAATSPASSPRAFAGPARAPMTDGARSLAVLKRKDQERAARRAAAARTGDASAGADASAPSSEDSARDDDRPRADDKTAAPADDLKLIKGVGPTNEKALNNLGVRRFAQIADWSPGNARWVAESIGFPGRVARERWVDQSKLLAAGVDTAYSSGVKSGAIAIGADADAPMSAQEAEAFANSLPQQAAAVENEASYSGARPLGLAAPRGGKADDLKLIKGIGKQNEERLHALGVWHFDQIAAWSAENVKWIGSYLAFPGRIDRERWIEQAAQFSRELAGRANSGDAQTSRLI